MDRKKTLLDPSLWVLIGVNLYLTWYYFQHKEIFTTLIWLYWTQSIMLGAFNILDMLTVRTVSPSKPGMPDFYTSRLRSSLFFLGHYGFMHLGYFIFLKQIKYADPIQWDLFKYFLYAFLFGQVINFIQHKIQQFKEPTDLGYLFILPYARIVPMHLTILIPAFLPITNWGVFIILKSIADVTMYIITSKTNKKSVELNKASLTRPNDILM